MDQSEARMKQCTEQMATQDINFTRLPAVDGNLLDKKTLEATYSYDEPDSYYKQLNTGEIGCYLSHREAWQYLIEQKLDFAIILEDDFQLTGDLKQAREAIAEFPLPWDYIKLAQNKRQRRSLLEITMKRFQFCVYNKIPAGTFAQAVSRQGAEKLLAASEKLRRPVDIDIQYWWDKDLKVFGLSPYPVALTQSQSSSTIDTDRPRKQAKRNRLKQMHQQLLFSWHNLRHTRKRIKALTSKLSESNVNK